ncbi:MAG: hypothetical protein ACM3PW_01250 [Chlamydiota bacterium]
MIEDFRLAIENQNQPSAFSHQLSDLGVESKLTADTGWLTAWVFVRHSSIFNRQLEPRADS